MPTLSTELLQRTFNSCFLFAEAHIGAQATGEIFQDSYRKILDYFPNLDIFYIDSNLLLQVDGANPDENQLLAFAVWIQQFIREFQQMMIGLPEIDIRKLTLEAAEALENAGFYDFYQQASQLRY